MAYKVIILYRLYMPSYFLGTFAEYPKKSTNRNSCFFYVNGYRISKPCVNRR